MYISISKQHQGGHFKGSVRDFAHYLDKENQNREPKERKHFFDQNQDQVLMETVIAEIDGNTSKLGKRDPKFYSLIVSPSQRELQHIDGDPDKLRQYTRELMKQYAKAFHRNREVEVSQLKYYAMIETERRFTGTDRQIQETAPYAQKILELTQERRRILNGKAQGNLKRIDRQIAKWERKAPNQIDGKRVVQGMKKPGMQQHVHIIVSHKDAADTHKLSPLSQHKAAETVLNGKAIKQGFDRDAFYLAAEKTFDREFGFNRNYVESYPARNLLDKDPKRFYAELLGLPMDQRQVAFKILHRTGLHVPTIPLNQAQLAYKALTKLSNGMEKAVESGSIGV
jgi:hypothetical protein